MVATTSYANTAKTAKSVGFGRDSGILNSLNRLHGFEIY